MKIAVGWGTRDRGLLVGLLVGALTLGNGVPYLAAFLGGADWRPTVVGDLAARRRPAGCSYSRPGSGRITPTRRAWNRAPSGSPGTDRRIRGAYLGYFGHMWELFAMWAWIGAALGGLLCGDARRRPRRTASASSPRSSPSRSAALACVVAGVAADRIGKAEVTILAMAASGTRGGARPR